MSWVAAAVVGGAVIGGVASNKAAGKAADAQVDAANSANQTQLEMYNQTRADQEPWRTGGNLALQRMLVGTGLVPGNGDLVNSFGTKEFLKDPGYQFRMDEGMKGVERGAAARGGLNSGRALKALSRYGQDYASNEYGNAFNRWNTQQGQRFNRLASIAGIGQTAVNQVASAGQNYANQASNNILQGGNARASGYIGQANALTGAIGQGINSWQQQQFLNNMNNRNTLGYNPGAGYGSYAYGNTYPEAP